MERSCSCGRRAVSWAVRGVGSLLEGLTECGSGDRELGCEMMRPRRRGYARHRESQTRRLRKRLCTSSTGPKRCNLLVVMQRRGNARHGTERNERPRLRVPSALARVVSRMGGARVLLPSSCRHRGRPVAGRLDGSRFEWSGGVCGFGGLDDDVGDGNARLCGTFRFCSVKGDVAGGGRRTALRRLYTLELRRSLLLRLCDCAV